MDIATYSLRGNQAESDRYYKEVAAFTDEVLHEAAGRLSYVVELFQDYLSEIRRDQFRSRLECFFELLLWGVLWESYGGNALKNREISLPVLSGLAWLRRNVRWLKPGADFLRGVLATLNLFSDNQAPGRRLPATPAGIDRLVKWLAATGEYYQEIKQLAVWRDFWAALPAVEVSRIINDIILFAKWFELQGRVRLGHYTSQVEEFLKHNYKRHYWREDIIFCGRKLTEYHVSMVGAEILNRAYREDFLNTTRKFVLLPACIRYHSQSRCRANKILNWGLQCSECTPGCKVSQLTKMGKEYDIDVRIIPHASVLPDQPGRLLFGGRAGIAGVACVATLISGGYLAKSLNLPAQCVILDYCGCKHWRNNSIPTDINLAEFKRILNIE